MEFKDYEELIDEISSFKKKNKFKVRLILAFFIVMKRINNYSFYALLSLSFALLFAWIIGAGLLLTLVFHFIIFMVMKSKLFPPDEMKNFNQSFEIVIRELKSHLKEKI